MTQSWTRHHKFLSHAHQQLLVCCFSSALTGEVPGSVIMWLVSLPVPGGVQRCFHNKHWVCALQLSVTDSPGAPQRRHASLIWWTAAGHVGFTNGLLCWPTNHTLPCCSHRQAYRHQSPTVTGLIHMCVDNQQTEKKWGHDGDDIFIQEQLLINVVVKILSALFQHHVAQKSTQRQQEVSPLRHILHHITGSPI